VSSITDELRNENYEIIKILANSKRFTMRTLQGRKTLFDNKDKLLNHIKKEDDTIHHTLKNATGHHPSLKQSLEMFKNEVEGTSKIVKGFFIKHSANDGTKELSDDFNILYTMLTHRIEKEENIFYAEYDDIQKEEELLKNMLL
jgi:hypothetical protein